MTDQPTCESARCHARRSQILEAAASCFAQHGFHATSIAKLSQACGMSPGHIYHFFPSKEAIITALIEQKLDQSLDMVRQFEDAEDVFQAMLDRVDLGLQERSDLESAALELEILAEAARNPRVAESVRTADKVRRERLRELMQRASRERGREPTDKAAETEIMITLFDGLYARFVNHPELDREALAPLLRKALETFV
ncbi:TetR/AcrR family transcriptional regulator [Thiorhodococcus minor]|uniref:TetR/AcrR family transcriptional regulator n=1 Tax=Thiorhodococcus minor TaxID=57489 RepID=A0A6M0JU86_9GAMM|nr:TetR/AcrR family transcriptional regulator [Thiorhodococcus minor]NEV61082.1 TetR/AcrR family transcriptional regulator [Thiorhodococcus minor]